jgi:hypothetical protein
MAQTTIILNKDTVKLLKETKAYPRETYNELLRKMIKIFLEAKRRSQYDEFLHRIQQAKMRELWDNKEDEAWENA